MACAHTQRHQRHCRRGDAKHVGWSTTWVDCETTRLPHTPVIISTEPLRSWDKHQSDMPQTLSIHANMQTWCKYTCVYIYISIYLYLSIIYIYILCKYYANSKELHIHWHTHTHTQHSNSSNSMTLWHHSVAGDKSTPEAIDHLETSLLAKKAAQEI